MNIEDVENYILEKLRKSLSPTLYYHGAHHTDDVVASALNIAAAEGIVDEESLILLNLILAIMRFNRRFSLICW